MGLLFAFFLIGLPLAAGVAELMLMTGTIKNDVWSSKIGGFTPRLPVSSVKPVPAPVPAEPVPASFAPAPPDGTPVI